MSWPPAALLLALLAAPSSQLLLPKCCPLGQTIIKKVCQPTDLPIPALAVHGPDLTPLASVQAEYRYAPLDCKDRILHRDAFWTLQNGSIHRGEGYNINEKYCIENLPAKGGYRPQPVFCVPSDVVAEEMSYVINSVGYLLSIPLALATVVVYATLAELRTLHGSIVICSLCPFIVVCVFLALTGFKIVHRYSIFCIPVGYAIQFFFMATFFWLNVMCFDIYWAFSGLRSLTGSVKERDRKKLILYSVYAWGAPLLILLVTLGIDYSPSIPNDSPFKPKVGVEKCFFITDFATGIYFYMPMGIVILINIILFSITAVRIFTLRRETKVLNREDSRKHTNSTNDKESVSDQHTLVENKTSTESRSGENRNEPYLVKNIRFTLYLKLFCVMGINWVMELISFLAGGPSYIWYIPDFTNTLQGVFIFIIFVWKKRVRRLIWDKLRSCCGKKNISAASKTRTTSTRNTSTSGISQNTIKMQPVSNPNPATPQAITPAAA